MLSKITEEVRVGGESFRFELCRKLTQLGEAAVDHWWMRTTELYRQRCHRDRTGGNYEAVTSAYRALCRPDDIPDENEVYLLARLLPWVRNQGGRRIVADAVVGTRSRIGRAMRKDVLEDLDGCLRDPSLKALTELEFSRGTGDVLGPAVYSDADREEYFAVSNELFAPVLPVLAHDEEAAFALLRDAWGRRMRSIGRRGGRQREKRLLDVLSYEARAALQDCYSSVWESVLLPHLKHKYALSAESERFLKFWHSDHKRESNEGEHVPFHLFHGHVFALHQAGALFLSTPAGQGLTGAWLAEGGSEAAYQRLLGGLYLAVFQYDALRHKAAEERRRSQAHSGRVAQARERTSPRRHQQPNA